jgi:peptidyl-prolyl cis-trans isomerase C
LFVGDTPISEADIAREMQHHRAVRPEESRAAAARALVVRELLRREIERLGLASEVQAAGQQAAGQESAEEAGIRLLLEREITDRVPTGEDCRRYYEQNRERFRSPDRIRVRHILLAAPADDVKGRFQARADAEALIAQLGTDPVLFADFALRRSDCPSKSEGGDLGWLERGQTTPEFDRQVFRLAAGLAAFPVESRWGYHVVQVDAIEAGTPLSFDDVQARIADYLELQVRQRELQHYLESLQAQYGVRGLAEIEALAEGQT